MWSAVDSAGPPLAAIFSVSSTELSEDEKALFRQADPLGFILFARNCRDPGQLRSLTGELKETVARHCPVLIDQEGGRVQRLRPPHWAGRPAPRSFGEMYEAGDEHSALEACYANALLMGRELAENGINVNCSPVLDLLLKQTHESIGDRAFSGDREVCAALGEAVCRGLVDAGVTPVIKHMPGQGRAVTDSHFSLPEVDEPPGNLQVDLQPFKSISSSALSLRTWGMVAHVIYRRVDEEKPASLSSNVINGMIRSETGFKGFLVTDDLAMKALDGFGDVTVRAGLAIEAGCDAVLHCNGDLKEMDKLAGSLPALREGSVGRLNESVIGTGGVPGQGV